MNEFVLNALELDEAGKDFTFPLSTTWLARGLAGTEVEAGGSESGVFAGRAYKQGADVVVRGRVQAQLATPCVRCLEPAAIAVDLEITALMTARGPDLRPEPDEQELTPEDLDREFYDGERVILDGLVREHLLLEVPIQPLCSPQCEGIAVPDAVRGIAASAPERTDPRLAPLQKLVGTLKPTEE